MRDPKRIPIILSTIRELWLKAPDLRLGQIIENALLSNDTDLFYMEDDTLVSRIKDFIENFSG